jgi:hypothetical protein
MKNDWKSDCQAQMRVAEIYRQAGLMLEYQKACFQAAFARSRYCWRCGHGYSHADGCDCPAVEE